MGRHKVGLIIPHPEDQKWDAVWKIFRTPNLNLPTLAALIPDGGGMGHRDPGRAGWAD